MPFGEYDSMDDCKQAHSDKNDPGAYCAEIHYQITGEYPGQKAFYEVYDDAVNMVETSLEAMKAVGKSPTEERLGAIAMKASIMEPSVDEKQNDPKKICGDLWFNEHDTYADSFGNGSQGRGTDERPPEAWWNECVQTIADSGREAIDIEGEE